MFLYLLHIVTYDMALYFPRGAHNIGRTIYLPTRIHKRVLFQGYMICTMHIAKAYLIS